MNAPNLFTALTKKGFRSWATAMDKGSANAMRNAVVRFMFYSFVGTKVINLNQVTIVYVEKYWW
jgi:hypothetical protein